jgi:hypothetical protein
MKNGIITVSEELVDKKLKVDSNLLILTAPQKTPHKRFEIWDVGGDAELSDAVGKTTQLQTDLDVLNQVFQVFDGESVEVCVWFMHLHCIHFLLCTDVLSKQINWFCCTDIKCNEHDTVSSNKTD